jgi:hypothetical protein
MGTTSKPPSYPHVYERTINLNISTTTQYFQPFLTTPPLYTHPSNKVTSKNKNNAWWWIYRHKHILLVINYRSPSPSHPRVMIVTARSPQPLIIFSFSFHQTFGGMFGHN